MLGETLFGSGTRFVIGGNIFICVSFLKYILKTIMAVDQMVKREMIRSFTRKSKNEKSCIAY